MMSDPMERLADEIDEYLELCKIFHEEPEMTDIHGAKLPDCTGDHARRLWERFNREVTEKREAELARGN